MPRPFARRCGQILGLALVLLVAGQAAVTVAPAATAARPPAVAAAQTPAAGSSQTSAAIGPGDADPLLYDAVLPAERDRIYAKTAGWLSRYRIAATITPAGAGEPGTITGTLDLRFVNDSGGVLPELYFRLYANDPAYAEGSLTVRDVQVAGEPVMPEQSVDDTVLRVPLPAPLAADEAIDVRLAFTATVPVRPRQTYGIYAVQPASGTWALAHWFPLLAGRDAGGWHLDPVSVNGDPIFSSTALFDVTMTAPADLVVVATGLTIAEDADDDQVRRRIVSGPVRDFTVVADDNFESVSRVVDGTMVTSYYDPEHTAGGADVLEYGVQALVTFSELIAVYPYLEMDLVEAELSGAAGVEFPQLILMGTALYTDRGSRDHHYLEMVTAHEVAHQWFYALVGNNQYQDAFIDEGLVDYLANDVYFTAVYDAATARRQFGLNIKRWYLAALLGDGDQIVDQPTDAFPSEVSYAVTVYRKGALGFAAIRTEIGDDAFFAALRDYYDRFEFGIATPADLLAAFERASGQDLGELWRHWFEAAEGDQDFDERDYLELLVELGLR